MKKFLSKYKFIFLWFFLLIYLVLSLGFIAIKYPKIQYSGINFIQTDTTKYQFVTRDDIAELLAKKKVKVAKQTIAKMNLAEVENLIKHLSAVKSAKVYKTIHATRLGFYAILNVEVEQRNPILRIINQKGKSYYIDDEGTVMPLSATYSARVLVANGYIRENQKLRNRKSILNIENDTIVKKNFLNDLFVLAKYIKNQEFWNSQIQQIYINENHDIELIPLVGNHTLIFGTIDEMELKFQKLKAMYDIAFKTEGWNEYKIINLKFSKQVVCSK